MKILKSMAIIALLCSGVTVVAVEQKIPRRSEDQNVSSVINEILAKKKELEEMQRNTDKEARINKASCEQKWNNLVKQAGIKHATAMIYADDVGFYQGYGVVYRAYIYDTGNYNPNKPWEKKLCTADTYLFTVYAANKLLSKEDKILLEEYYDQPTSEWPISLQRKLKPTGVIEDLDSIRNWHGAEKEEMDNARKNVLEHMIACGNI